MKLKKIYLAPLLFLLAACSHRTMTQSSYNEVQLGETFATVEARTGRPYDSREMGDGICEYIYVEAFNQGHKTILENRYFLLVKDGTVVGKRMETERPPPYELIYYQTPNEKW